MKILSKDYKEGYQYGRASMNKYRYDELTGLEGRHDFKARINELYKKKIMFHLVLADVNGLKRTNDTYGYVAGDALIVACVDHLKECVPDADVYRYSGDEFCILVTGKDDFHSDDLHCPTDICSLATKFSNDYSSYAELFEATNKLLKQRKAEHYIKFPNDRRK